MFKKLWGKFKTVFLQSDEPGETETNQVQVVAEEIEEVEEAPVKETDTIEVNFFTHIVKILIAEKEFLIKHTNHSKKKEKHIRKLKFLKDAERKINKVKIEIPASAIYGGEKNERY